MSARQFSVSGLRREISSQELADKVRSGDRPALARLLTEVENDSAVGRQALDRLYSETGKAHRIGVTGSPGTGKSSLVNQLTRLYRRERADFSPRRVAIVAVDPSSPFTGGAVLGDRVRMRDLAGDPGVFIRSMASRGALGGLARSTAAVVQVFDAAGFDVVLIETVGAGQAEVDIAALAHTTLVVEAPGLGDDIQAIKAGILEIADILVVNKADRPGADHTLRALQMMLEMANPTGKLYLHPSCPLPPLSPEEAAAEVDGEGASDPAAEPAAAEPAPAGDPAAASWTTPVLATVATVSTGVEALFQTILDHEAYLRSSGEWHRREWARLQSELGTLLQSSLVARWRESVSEERYRSVLRSLVRRRVSPYQAVSSLMDQEEKAWMRTHQDGFEG
jgi:LAO/AO transport system kinase